MANDTPPSDKSALDDLLGKAKDLLNIAKDVTDLTDGDDGKTNDRADVPSEMPKWVIPVAIGGGVLLLILVFVGMSRK